MALTQDEAWEAIHEASSVTVPDESGDQVGDGTDISKEVNPDGTPLDDEKQDEVRKEFWNAQAKLPTLFTKHLPEVLGVEEYSQAWKDDSGEQPYCPVLAFKTDTGRVFVSYVTGAINDVNDYIDLIDTLLIAKEEDVYYIFIDSPGGLVASGGIISSAIHHSKATVFTVARGLCASSAALIHSSAKAGHSIVTPFAVMMYHMSSHFDGGTSTKVAERALNQVRYVNECVLNKAVDEGHLTQDEFNQIQNGKEIYVPAEEFLARTSKRIPSAEGETK